MDMKHMILESKNKMTDYVAPTAMIDDRIAQFHDKLEPCYNIRGKTGMPKPQSIRVTRKYVEKNCNEFE